VLVDEQDLYVSRCGRDATSSREPAIYWAMSRAKTSKVLSLVLYGLREVTADRFRRLPMPTGAEEFFNNFNCIFDAGEESYLRSSALTPPSRIDLTFFPSTHNSTHGRNLRGGSILVYTELQVGKV
jgi:hypothetical protein